MALLQTYLSVLAAAAQPGLVPTGPFLRYEFTLQIDLAAPIEQGIVEGRRRRFIPIDGGKFQGPRLSGVVLPGGGDWQSIGSDGRTELDASYSLKASDGTVIAIHNPGLRVATQDVTERLARGEEVSPDAYYFRSSPRFTVQAGPHEWLMRRLFIGRGIRRPNSVEIEIFSVD